jgi:betaine reductase
MDLENQKRVKAFAEQFGKENIVVLLGGADAEASGLIAETVIAGDPAYAGALTGVQLGLPAYHVLEPEIKKEVDPAVWEKNIAMMEMVLSVDDIVREVSSIRQKFLA